MSHHLDSPLSRQDVRLNITDIYVFGGEQGTVLVMDVNNTISGPDAPKGFHPEARYEFRIDVNGDAVEELAYRVTFGSRDQEGRQTVELRRLSGPDTRDPAANGALLAAGSTESPISGENGLRLWAGPAAEPFYIDPTVLSTLSGAFRDGTKVDLSAWNPAAAVNLFKDTSVSTIVLELPESAFDGVVGPQRRIGVWATTMLATDAGGWHPINRAGLPMIQPIFNPSDSERASIYNTSVPSEDRVRYGALFAGLISNVVAAHETTSDAAAYGAAVAGLLLPDILTYQLGSQASFSFAGRNGRALTDDAVAVMAALVTNSAVPTGLSRRAASPPHDRFPYLAVSEAAAAQLVNS